MESSSRTDRTAGPRLFTSRIARRVFGQFVLAALLPLVVFAWLSLRSTTRQLEQQTESRLHEVCKSVGMTAIERLGHVRDDLARLVGDSDADLATLRQGATEDLRARLEERFEWLAVGNADAEVLEAVGDGVQIRPLTTGEREHIEEHAAAIIFPVTGPGEAALVLVYPLPGERRYLYGRVRPGFLWTGQGVSRPDTELMAMTAHGLVLYSDSPYPELQEAISSSLRGQPSSGHLVWRHAGEDQLASYRTMFVRPRFYRNFVVAQTKPRSDALAPVESFESMFVLFGALTLLGVVLTSLVQIRRSLVPIVRLKEGTRELAEDGPVRGVRIETGDEFEELADSFNRMAERIRERTHQLEEANRAKADFLANMSHEIRTPMTAVLGYAELSLADDVSEEERKRHLEIIHKNGEHLLHVVNEILDLSKVEAGELQVAPERCDPTELLRDVVALLSVNAEAKGIELNLLPDPSVPAQLVTDPTRLRQIVLNVLGNAIKYTDRGGVLVKSAWERRRGGGHWLRIHVRDSGPGIAPEQRERIFEPFYQADTSMSRRHGGTGLGLSLSRSLARLLGGDLTCDSELGRGSEFTITIDPDQLEAPAPALPAAAPALPAAGAEESADRGARVLLAEDVLINRRLVGTVLRRAGFEVDEAENGRVAHDKALAADEAGTPYDVVLMDMQMPEMDGYEATRRLREQGYDHPIIALTAHSFAGERERCLGEGCDDYTTKPIDKEALIALIRSYAASSATR